MKRKKRKTNKTLFWLPRILSILLIVFISIFALDVFGEYQGLDLMVALLMHLIPTIILIIILIIAWKWEKVGGILFIIGAIVATIFFHTYQDIVTLLLISLPPLIIGILFLIDKKLNS